MDSPARSSWLNIKQYNGYFGCSTCTEPGEQLDLGPGKKKARRQCHIYPFNKEFAGTTGHAELRKHNVLKQQALVAMSQISDRGKVYVSDTLYNCVLYKVHEGKSQIKKSLSGRVQIDILQIHVYIQATMYYFVNYIDLLVN